MQASRRALVAWLVLGSLVAVVGRPAPGGDATAQETLRPDPATELFRRIEASSGLIIYDATGAALEIWVWDTGGATEPFDSLGRGAQGRGSTLLRDTPGDAWTLESIVTTLERGEEGGGRPLAIWALEDIGGAKATAVLVETAQRDADAWIRSMALEALVKIGGASQTQALVQALREDPDPFVRYTAMVGLADVGARDLERLLRPVLNDPENLLRLKAAEILGL